MSSSILGKAKVSSSQERAQKENKMKEDADDCLKINPIRRHARLEDNILTFMADDGTEYHIDMTDCSVLSVSGGSEASRKWAKKYPIKVESRDRELFAGNFICLFYLETSREKEAWCQVLRAASRWARETEDWYSAQNREFHEYASRIDETYPAFPKSTSSRIENVVDEKGRLSKTEASLSRRQRLWKKLVRKGSSKGSALESKTGSQHADSKGNSVESKSGSGHEETQSSVSLQSQLCIHEQQDSGAASTSSRQLNCDKVLMDEKYSSAGFPKNLEPADTPVSIMPVVDQGTMCWNLFFTRLFFDSYHSPKFQAACHKRIQKQLSKIRTPGYIGGIHCTSVELGTIPPFFHSMHILPRDSEFIWCFEADIEYSGGAHIKLETRLDVHDSMSQDNVVNQSLEHTLAGVAAADILREGLESIEKGAGVRGQVANVANASELTRNLNLGSGDTKSGKATGGNGWMQSSRGGWKAMLSRFADHVSQVPFTLSLRLVSLKGTMRVQIKAPPTDRIWFGFTSMPTIDLQPEPSIGDHKITNSPVVAFITNRIKMLLNDTLVLPNCEGIWIPWMISETDDWVEQSAVPVPWSAYDTGDSTAVEDAQALKDANKSSITKERVYTTDVLLGNALSGSSPVSALSAERHLASELERPLLERLDLPSESESEGNLPLSVATKKQEIYSPGNTSSRISSNEIAEDRGKQLSRRAKLLKKLDEKRKLVLEKMREGFEKHEQPG